jgi:8-oxo-dGTP diphosphatase
MSVSGTATSTTTDPFHGAKVAVIWQGTVATLLRDDKPDIPWPGWWDLPGGGREGTESPWACACREAAEELALDLFAQTPRHASGYLDQAGRVVWFFVALPLVFDAAALRLGNEGSAWQMMPLDTFLTHPRVIPQFQTRLRAAI